ncbi:hypothetical protein, partial [Vibrio aestuarianus]|uniref:hypothetical protein n=1 Tax=Vibrio aestuarianus TaxID=28171 RepID=UPI001C20A4E7
IVNSVIMQLKKDFYAQIDSPKESSSPSSQTTLALLTEEEIQQLEQIWIELAVWKRNQSH